MEIQTHTSEQVKKITYGLNYLPINDQLCVYSLTTTTLTEDKTFPRRKGKEMRDTVEGIATLSTIDNYKKGRGSLKNAPGYFFAPPKFRELINKYGYSLGCDIYHRLTKNEKPYPGLGSDKKEELFTAFSQGQLPATDLLHMDGSSMWFTNPDGTAFPDGLYFDYMNGRIHNGCYDLGKAVEILNNNPRVIPIEDGRHYGELSDQMPLRIRNIPHYNADKYHTQFLEFVYGPTPEEAQALREKMLSYGGKYPSTHRYEAMFDLDILGLRKGGAAYYDQFHSHNPVPGHWQENED